MKRKLSFKIESLLNGIENPTGPIVQVLFAKRLAEHEGVFSFDRLACITFDNPKVNKAFTGGTPLDETLLIGNHYSDESELHLCVRAGNSCLKIATGYLPDRNIVFHPQYRHEILLDKLSDKEIEQVFNHVWDNPQSIEPLPKIWED